MSEEEKLNNLVKGAKTPGEAVKILMDKRIISTTALRDLDLYYTYKQRKESTNTMNAMYDTSISASVAPITVYRARKRFEE